MVTGDVREVAEAASKWPVPVVHGSEGRLWQNGQEQCRR